MNEANANQEIFPNQKAFRPVSVDPNSRRLIGAHFLAFSFPVSEWISVRRAVWSGKSTVLDAHAALLTPRVGVDFNVRPAKPNATQDRSVVTLPTRSLAQQTGDDGDTHRSTCDRTQLVGNCGDVSHRNRKYVVLAQLYGSAVSRQQRVTLKRLYLILEREFEIRELDFFPKRVNFEVRKIARPARCFREGRI